MSSSVSSTEIRRFVSDVSRMGLNRKQACLIPQRGVILRTIEVRRNVSMTHFTQ